MYLLKDLLSGKYSSFIQAKYCKIILKYVMHEALEERPMNDSDQWSEMAALGLL